MKNRLRMPWRAGAATMALAAAALFFGTSTASAQMHTEVIGAPASGAHRVDGGYGESGLITVHEDHGGLSLRTDGGYAGSMGPICTVEAVGGGRGYNEVFDGEACGIGGGYVEHSGDGRIESHYP